MSKVSNKEVKNAVIRGYGGKCVCCSENISDFLTIDHIYGDGHIERKTIKNSNSLYRKLIKEGFPKDRYRLMCFNCNCGSYQHSGVCPHFLTKLLETNSK